MTQIHVQEHQAQRRSWHPLSTVLFYGILGPLIGMFGMLAVFSLFAVFDSGHLSDLLIVPVAFVSPAVLIAYLHLSRVS